GVADAARDQVQQREAFGPRGHRHVAHRNCAVFQVNREHALYNRSFMPAELACFEERCRARFPITEVLYNCPHCGGLLEAVYGKPAQSPEQLKKLWRSRRTSNAPLDQSGVWRYREFIPFLEDLSHAVTLREGCTPLLDGRRAAAYG